MAEPAFDPQRPVESRFSPARLRAEALRHEIEATRVELAATIEALDSRRGQEVDGELLPFEIPDDRNGGAPGEEVVFEAGVEDADVVADPEPDGPDVAAPEAAEPGAGQPEPAGAGAEPPRHLAAAAMTFAAGLGAGLLLRRRR